MVNFKDKKIIGIIVISIIILITSVIIYRNNKSSSFKEEYMTEIFEGDTKVVNEAEANTEESINNSSVEESKTIIVEIKGEVIKPDVYELKEGSIVKDLIDLAGGLKEEADIRNINRAEELKDHELIIIGNINDEPIDTGVISAGTNINSNEEESTLININTAEIDDLKKITGIGDTKAQNIIDYREKNGGFKSLEDLKNVDGIGDKTFEKIKDEITL